MKDGTLSSDDQESIEVAQSCIAESFKVDPSNKTAMQDAIGGQNLLGIYGVYEKLKGKSAAGAEKGNATSTGSAPTSSSASNTNSTPSAAEKQEAEALKSQGNAAMAKKDYSAAIDAYSKAISIAPQNTIYLSNRAAAYSASHQHEKAKDDAELAVVIDPSYTKAWSRLGVARFALGDAKGSMEAYRKGIEYEGNGGTELMKKGFETAKRRVEEESGVENMDGQGGGDFDSLNAGSGRGAGGAGGMPDLAGLASMLGGGGGGAGRGGGGGGGMPDLASMMNNPMMASMAQKLMSNPQMLSSLMNNPQLKSMMEGFGGGGAGGAGRGSGGGGGGGAGGMPDLSSLMSDPNIAEL